MPKNSTNALLLSIETATGCGSVALTKGGISNGKILAEAIAQPEITHSRRLLYCPTCSPVDGLTNLLIRKKYHA